WSDQRNGTGWHIYAQRLDVSGAPQWSPDGVVLCDAGMSETYPVIVSDGVGGAIVAWYDARASSSDDVYAQRVNAAGVPLWTPNGVPICVGTSVGLYPAIAADDSGGAIVTWFDMRNGVSGEIFAQRLNPDGVPQWAPNGAVVCAAAGDHSYPVIVPDGAG